MFLLYAYAYYMLYAYKINVSARVSVSSFLNRNMIQFPQHHIPTLEVPPEGKKLQGKDRGPWKKKHNEIIIKMSK